jgi:DNA-binding CsgD family transcriptional regulator
LAWTPRQRQVLDRIGRGRTNAEIAEDLGISLAGAKWHVSEVLSKLGVASREEAAVYWREQHRVPVRLRRFARALVGFVPLKAVVATAGVTAVAGGVALTIGLLQTGDDDQPGATATVAVTTTPGQVYSKEQALERAIYIAGEYLKQTDIPETTEVSGRPRPHAR